VSLANFELDATFTFKTVLAEDILSDECVKELPKFGVHTDKILRGTGRMVIFFLDGGASQILSKIDQLSIPSIACPNFRSGCLREDILPQEGERI
jgi:hypothetical protein